MPPFPIHSQHTYSTLNSGVLEFRIIVPPQKLQVSKQKGFGCFDVAGYWQQKYRNSCEDEDRYLLTNIGTLKQAVTAFKCRSGIEAMFKNCKTGG